MPRMRWLILAAAPLLFACATGVTEDVPDTGAGGSGGTITGVGGGTGGNQPPGPTTTTTSGGGVGSEGGFGGMGEGGEGANGGSGGSCDFSATTTCPGTVLAAVRGDTGFDADVEHGTTSAWFNVEVTESLDNIFEDDLSYRVTLESPPGTDYDLIVHESLQVEEGGSGPDCSIAPMFTSVAGTTKTVENAYDDDQGIGGLDDTLWLVIEVRYNSGSDCINPWVLTVEGDP
jgi:hypothetical protein